MTVSLGELDSRTMLGLASAAEYLDLSDVHNAVVQRLNALTMQSRTSDVNVLLGTTDEFTPTEALHDVTSLIGKSVPCFVETYVNTVNEISYWQMVRVVNINEIDYYRNMGAFACAFYGDETSSETEQPTQYLQFTFLPSKPCRIRFDRDGQRVALNADIILPDNLSELPVLQAQNSLIPRVKFKIALDLRRDKELRLIAPMITAALGDIYMQNMVDMKPLDAQWRVWAFRDRAAQSSFNNPTPSSEAMYANGRNRGAGGYGGGY
mgnify:CR=1 FL=1